MMEARDHLTFHLGGRQHALPMACVREMVFVPFLQPTERVPPNILGIFALRGEPVPVLDLAALLGMEARPLAADNVLIIFCSPSGAGPYGLIVEGVEDLLAFEPSELKRPMTDPETGESAPLVSWLGLKNERVYHLLDLDLVAARALGGSIGTTYEAMFGGLDPDLETRLRSRAEASTQAKAEDARTRIPCVELRLGGERLALPLAANLQVAHCPPVFPVPAAHPALLGLANLAGEPLLVVDLRPLLGLPGGTLLPQAFLLVVEDGPGRLGLYAEEVGEVLSIAPEDLQDAPAGEGRSIIRGEWLEAGLVFHLLDLPTILAHPDLNPQPLPR